MMKNSLYVLCICLVIFFPLSVVGQTKTIEIKNNQTSHVVFHADIIYADIGDNENYIISYTNNILRIKGVKTLNQTNLTVLTKDQFYYSFFVKYHENPRLNYFIKPAQAIQKFNQEEDDKKASSKKKKVDYFTLPTRYKQENQTASTPSSALKNKSNIEFKPNKTIKHINQKGNQPVRQQGERRLNEIKKKAAKLLDKRDMYDYIGKTNGDILLKVTGIYHSLDNAYIVYEIRNSGAIPYDISYIEFGIRERRRPKKAAVHERKLTPIYTAKEKITRVPPRQVNKYVAVFGKLALPSDRLLYLEVVEDGRNINLDILYHKLAIKRIY